MYKQETKLDILSRKNIISLLLLNQKYSIGQHSLPTSTYRTYGKQPSTSPSIRLLPSSTSGYGRTRQKNCLFG